MLLDVGFLLLLATGESLLALVPMCLDFGSESGNFGSEVVDRFLNINGLSIWGYCGSVPTSVGSFSGGTIDYFLGEVPKFFTLFGVDFSEFAQGVCQSLA